jgi:uncharacterized UBP type Zn finger protein
MIMSSWHPAYNDLRGQGVACGHLNLIADPAKEPDPEGACRECLLEGTRWVELRTCLICGHNGCCESSPRRHAAAHFRDTGHPIIANASGGPAWAWCYIDELALTPDGADTPAQVPSALTNPADRGA